MTPLKRNYIYSVAFQVLNILTPLITAPYVSRVFGAQVLGDYYYTFTISSYFSVLAMLGLLNHGSRAIATCQGDAQKRTQTFLEIYLVQLSVSLLAVAAYLLLTSLVFSSELRPLFVAGNLIVLSAAFDISWLFWGMERFRITALVSCITKILVLCLIFILVKDCSDILSYAYLIGLSFFLSHLSYLPLAAGLLDLTSINLLDILKGSIKHIRPCLVLFLPVVAVSFYIYFSKILLGLLSEHSELTFFENGYKIVLAPLGLITALGSVMVPRISSIVKEGDTGKVREYLDHSTRYVTALAVPMILGIMAIADLLTDVLFGTGFERTTDVMILLSGSLIFMAWANIIRTTLLIPWHRDMAYVSSVLTGAILNILLNLLLIPSYGCMGAAFASLLTELTVFLVQVILTRRDLDLGLYPKCLIRYLVLGISMYLSIALFRRLAPLDGMMLLLSSVLLGIAVYSVLLIVFDPYMRNMVRSIINSAPLGATKKP